MTDIPATSPRHEHVPLGILYMLGATVMFAASSALSKWLVATYPVGEVLFVRTGISLILLTAFILPGTGLAVFRTRRLGTHIGRGLWQGTAQICLIIAFTTMPLADALAINFSAPLFTTLAAALVLRETVGAARWAALLVGFIGVLIVTKPGTSAFSTGALFALGNAVLYGSVTVAVRSMASTESAKTLIVYQMLVLFVMFGGLLVFGVRAPENAFDAGLMVTIGITNTLAQYWWTRSLHLAPASAVTPFYYFMLVWSIMLGFAVWGDVPTPGLLIGSAIVVCSGLFLLWHEKRKAVPPPVAAT